ncbi:MAG: class I SAM-dependent methyltransferase [Nanoarchaeota archaeon]
MIITGNYFNKYTSRNPLVRFLLKRFVRTYLSLTALANGDRWLDVGCGEGYLLSILHKKEPHWKITGIDIGDEELALARKALPDQRFVKGQAYELPFKDDSFDLVAANEVLEHVKKPSRMLKEMKRVSSKYVLISVPNEPWFRIANVIRMKYLYRLGDTPGHVQNFSKRSLERLLEKQFKTVLVKNALIWNFALCVKK